MQIRTNFREIISRQSVDNECFDQHEFADKNNIYVHLLTPFRKKKKMKLIWLDHCNAFFC